MGGGVLRGPCGSPHFSGADPCSLCFWEDVVQQVTAHCSAFWLVKASGQGTQRRALEPLTMSPLGGHSRVAVLGQV